jgi:hypothetical protein
VLLTPQQRQQLKADWQALQKPRALRRPIPFTTYEATHNNVVARVLNAISWQSRHDRVVSEFDQRVIVDGYMEFFLGLSKVELAEC